MSISDRLSLFKPQKLLPILIPLSDTLDHLSLHDLLLSLNLCLTQLKIAIVKLLLSRPFLQLPYLQRLLTLHLLLLLLHQLRFALHLSALALDAIKP